MNVRYSMWKWVCATFCLNAAVALAEDPKPVFAVDDRAGNVQFRVLREPADGRLEIVAEETPPGPPQDVLTEVLESKHGIVHFTVNTDSQGKYWIGLLCAPASDALRSQLELAADTGLIVEEVSDGGPAKKAGIQQFDVLLSAVVAGKAESEARSLSNSMDLVNVVQAAETAPMKIEFLRRGKKQTLELSPEERPKQAAAVYGIATAASVPGAMAVPPQQPLGLRWAGPIIVNLAAAPIPEGMAIEFQPAEGAPQKVIVKQKEQTWEADVKSLDKLPEEIALVVRQQVAARNTPVARSAVAYRKTAATPPSLVVHGAVTPLPDDVSVTVLRKGSAPAAITIKKGDQTWEATEQDLSKLPKEIRPIADSVLTNHAVPARAMFTTAVPVPWPNVTTVNAAGVAAPQVTKVRTIQPSTVTNVISVTPQTAEAVKAQAAAAKATAAQAKAAQATARQDDVQRQLKDLSEQVEKLRLAIEKNQPKQ